MRRFDLVLPNSLEDCVKILAERGGQAKLVAGGTDLLPQMKNGVLKPSVVVDLSGIARVRQIQGGNGQGLRIGAAVTARELEMSPAAPWRLSRDRGERGAPRLAADPQPRDGRAATSATRRRRPTWRRR